MSRRSSLRCRAARSPSLETVQIKLSQIVSRQEQLKVAYHQLHSRITVGLHEAEDVLASLAIPLMKLVGLKTVEMATEGRFSSVVTSIDHSHSQEENNYMARAIAAGNEQMERQKLRLTQLIGLLKRIEAHVNSSHNSISQNLANHRAFMKKFFIKTFIYISAINQSSQSNDLSYMMLKILKATFDQVGLALRSVEVGIDDLMCELAEKMCNPMVEYVNGLKVEMKTGMCMQLLEVVKEMDEAIRVGKFELEEARKQAELAEQSRTETLSELHKSEETARKLTMSLGLLTEDAPESQENSTQQESLSKKEDQTAKDDNLLWDLLRMKRKCKEPDSSLQIKELPGTETTNKKLKLPRSTPSPSHRLVTNSQSKGPNIRSPFTNSSKLLCSLPSSTTQKAPLTNSRELLCSSPSSSAQKVLRCKRITP